MTKATLFDAVTLVPVVWSRSKLWAAAICFSFSKSSILELELNSSLNNVNRIFEVVAVCMVGVLHNAVKKYSSTLGMFFFSWRVAQLNMAISSDNSASYQ